MKNKVYMITGASSGIGEECVRKLADESNTLIIIARNYNKLMQLSTELPGTIIPIEFDLNDLENIKSIFDTCKEKKLKLDGLVYCAGVNADCPIKVNNINLMQEAMTVNCFAFLEMGKHFYSKRYSNDNGSIVAISSLASLVCERGMAPYSASKAALNAVIKTMSKEFLRRKIRVNGILPAGVATPMADQKVSVLEGIALSKNNETEDVQELGIIPSTVIADHVDFLLSNASQYTTGELLTIGAGRSY